MKTHSSTHRHFTFCAILVFLLFVLSCQKKPESSASVGHASEEQFQLSEEPVPKVGEITRKLIKEANLIFETGNLAESKKQIEHGIKKHQGYIASENENKLSGSLSRTLTVRIPTKQFDFFIQDVTKGVEHFDTKDIHIKDVTEEFVDIQARLRTKKELENRYLDLLKKANKVSEILEIEKQIGDLRADIEATEGRLRYLENQTAYSTISITYYKLVPKQTAFTYEFREGFSNGWQNFIWFMVGLVNIWPFLLFIALSIFIIRKWWKKRKSLLKK